MAETHMAAAETHIGWPAFCSLLVVVVSNENKGRMAH
jgi:hypothetical protein